MASAKKQDADLEESDLLKITPLGAGQEVGRSCIILEFKNKKIMFPWNKSCCDPNTLLYAPIPDQVARIRENLQLDCGIHPGYNGLDSLPFIDEIDPAEIDLLLISHFHLDHCGGLPWFLEKGSEQASAFLLLEDMAGVIDICFARNREGAHNIVNIVNDVVHKQTHFKGRVFMTHATKAIYRWLLSDYIKVSNISADHMLYSEKDLEKSMDKIETVHFHQEKDVGGVKFWCYNAGHVLGAAMFMIEIAGVKILYTGDFSRQEDRHLMAAEIPNVAPDVLIMESTYGTHVHEKREAREKRFTSQTKFRKGPHNIYELYRTGVSGTVHDIINRGGRCLIPVFALGRAQELLLILDEYWNQHPELHDVPIYYASSLAKKCMAVYQTYIGAMNERIRKQINVSNPFVFKHISNLKSIDQFDDIGPSVVMASPGMMQSGLSRELFETWCTDRRNGVIIAGYCVEGTLAKDLMSEPEEVVTMSGQLISRKMEVSYISFSAHADYEQISEFVNILKPPHIVLVHGEQNEMSRLKAGIIREFDDNGISHIQVYNPKNVQSVELHFRGEKMAKVIGSLAGEKPCQGKKVSGLLLKRGFNYHVMAPSDLHNYTDLSTSTISQRQVIYFRAPFSLVYYCLKQLAGKVEKLDIQGKPAYRVFDAITVIQDRGSVFIEWISNPVNDMYADCVLTVVLQVEGNPQLIQANKDKAKDAGDFTERLLGMLRAKYGVPNVTESDGGDAITVTLDGAVAIIDLETLTVECQDESLNHLVTTAVHQLSQAMTPIST